MDLDPVKAWKKLHDLYGRGVVGIRHVLLTQLLATKYNGHEGILIHKAKLATIRKQLVNAGEAISDQHFLSIFISSLPESFDTLITSINLLKLLMIFWDASGW